MKIYQSLALLVLSMNAQNTIADPDHYKNVLIGERAAGLGGAFVAISDDPSGIYYNPAGLAFSFEDYVSISANAFNVSNATFKDVFPGFDYKVKSASFVPSFFGFSQSFGAYKGGIAIIVPNYDLYDQQDELKNYNADTTGTGNTNYNFRRFFRQDITYLGGVALAREFFKNFSIGSTVFLQYRTLKSIDNQTVAYNPVPDGNYFHQNVYISGTNLALVPKIGAQYMPVKKWSLGFAAQLPIHLSSKVDVKIDKTTQEDEAEGNSARNPQNGVFSNDWIEKKLSGTLETVRHFSVTTGAAFFPNQRWVISSDIDLYFPALNTAEKFFFNFALGAEYYITDTLPLRIGMYSNRSAAATTESEFGGLNLLGGSLGVSFLTKSSSFTMGTAYLYGKGKGNIVGKDDLKTVVYTQLNLFVTGSYQL